MDDVAVAAQVASLHEGEFAGWAGVDVGDFEFSRSGGGFGFRRGGLGEERAGEKGKESDFRERSHHYWNLKRDGGQKRLRMATERLILRH
jgi:hypothetical protein